MKTESNSIKENEIEREKPWIFRKETIKGALFCLGIEILVILISLLLHYGLLTTELIGIYPGW